MRNALHHNFISLFCIMDLVMLAPFRGSGFAE
jgi:hypothetical protein